MKTFKISIALLGLLLLLTITRCQKEKISVPPTETDVRFLGHRGGGTNLSNDKYIENTLPSVQDGLKTMNGVEVDLMMSLDGTIWIYHNSDIGESSCLTNYHHSLVLLHDTEIEKIQICSRTKQDRIYKLEELKNLWSNTPAGFIISMHIKLDFPADTINNTLIGGEAAYLSKLANNLTVLYPTIKHPDQLILEVYDAAFCRKIQSTIPGIKVCLIKEVTFPKQINDALAIGYDGVSCNITEPTLTVVEVKRARDNGLIVQLWTPDSKEELQKAINMKPNYIQTNNLDAINLLNLHVNL